MPAVSRVEVENTNVTIDVADVPRARVDLFVHVDAGPGVSAVEVQRVEPVFSWVVGCVLEGVSVWLLDRKNVVLTDCVACKKIRRHFPRLLCVVLQDLQSLKFARHVERLASVL